MASIKCFEDLEIWKQARNFNKEIYPFFQQLRVTSNYELLKQMERSAGSIMDNIAEGFDRDGNREFRQFLSFAKASAAEVQSQLYRALDRELISQESFDNYSKECSLISNKIGALMSYLRNSEMKGKKFR
jgi:four helix bundle protein